MSDIINALTSAPHGATHIGFYGDDIIFIKEHEEARSDAWGIESTQWQEIEDFDVSLIYGVRAIKDVKIEAELLKQIEQIKAERDALAREVDAANDRNAELIEERDALAARIQTAERVEKIFSEIPELKFDDCLKLFADEIRNVQAEAIDNATTYLAESIPDKSYESVIFKDRYVYISTRYLREYAAKLRQGGE